MSDIVFSGGLQKLLAQHPRSAMPTQKFPYRPRLHNAITFGIRPRSIRYAHYNVHAVFLQPADNRGEEGSR